MSKAVYAYLLTKDEDGMWVATVPELPGCISQGRTKAEAKRNIREAIELTLEDEQTDRVVVQELSLERVQVAL
jgi:predicted RNase H-like HicB family nuclease